MNERCRCQLYKNKIEDYSFNHLADNAVPMGALRLQKNCASYLPLYEMSSAKSRDKLQAAAKENLRHDKESSHKRRKIRDLHFIPSTTRS
jgi:hypothetical protein